MAVSGSEKYCKVCQKAKTCSSLCASAEKYVNKDFVKRSSNEILYRETDSFLDNEQSLDYIFQKHGISASSLPYLERFSQDVEIDLSFLTPREHFCVEFFYYEGKPSEEIAGMLHITKGAVDFYLSNARKKIKRKIENGEDVKCTNQAYTYHNPNRPLYGWQGLLVNFYFLKGLSPEECQKEFIKIGYDYYGNSQKALSNINRLIKYYKENNVALSTVLRKIMEPFNACTK